MDDLADQGESCREWEDYEAAVAPAILGLSPEQEAVVRLRYFAGLSYREIGIMCDIGVRLVKSRLHEAKQVLRKTIPDHYRGNNVPQYILKRSKEKIMRTLDLIVKAAYVIRALSLNHQILVCRCAKEGARLDEEVLTAVSGIRNGKEVIEGFEGRFTIEDLVRIFGSSRTLENWIIENLDERDPALSEEFKSRMFVFEDIVLLPPDAVRKILAKVPAETMVTAMLSCFKELKLYVMSFFEKEERNELLGKIPELETDKKNVDAAQFEVVRIIAQMEASKEIAVRRPADFEETMRKHLAMQNVRTG